MARQPAKKAAAKKASKKAQTKAQAKPRQKQTKAATVEAMTASKAENKSPMAFMLAGTLALGVGIGMIVQSQNNSAPAEMSDDQIAAFIENNPKLILDTVRDYTTRLDQEQRQQAINMVKVDDGTTILGNPNGDVTIYEFSDYNCGYCKRSFASLQELLQQDGNVRVVIKEFPILAQSSLDAANLAFAAGEIGKFEEFHTALMQWQGALDDQAFDLIAEQAGTSLEELRAAFDADKADSIIAANREMAQSLQISGTPAFIIGDIVLPGAVSLEEMQAAVTATREAQDS